MYKLSLFPNPVKKLMQSYLEDHYEPLVEELKNKYDQEIDSIVNQYIGKRYGLFGLRKIKTNKDALTAYDMKYEFRVSPLDKIEEELHEKQIKINRVKNIIRVCEAFAKLNTAQTIEFFDGDADLIVEAAEYYSLQTE